MIQSARRKGTLEDRQNAARDRIWARTANSIPARMIRPEVRARRLRVIKQRMGLSAEEFASMLRISLDYTKSMLLGRRPTAMAFLDLAEIHLKRFLDSEKRGCPVKPVACIPPRFVKDTKLKAKVIAAYVRGKDAGTIARELVIRPEVVTYYLSKLEM